jgi:hypothetical protein
MKIRAGCLAIALLSLIGSLALGQEAPKSKPAVPAQTGIQVPQPEVLLLLIRSALIGLDHANRTGNYSVLRELGGPGLQQHSSAQLSNAFAALRTNKIDLLPAAILTPQLVQQPAVSPEGLLQLIGYLPTQPKRIEFHIVYQPAGGQWKLFGVNVGLADAPAPTDKVEPKAAVPEPSKPRAAPEKNEKKK